MKRLLFLMSIVLLPGCDWSSRGGKTIQGAGKKARQERPIKTVNEVQLSGVGKLILTQSDTESLVIKADEKVLPHIISEVDDGTLFIHPANDMQLRSKSEIVYRLSLKNIKEIELSGAVEMEAKSITANELKLECSGSTRIKAGIAVDRLKVDACGSAKIYLEGDAKKQKIEASGSVHYDAGALESARAKIESEGASRVTVAVRKKLEVKSSGVSVVSYKGNPHVKINSSGASSVQKVG